MKTASERSLWIAIDKKYSDWLTGLYPIAHDRSYQVGTFTADELANVSDFIICLDHAFKVCTNNALLVIVVDADDLPNAREAINYHKEVGTMNHG